MAIKVDWKNREALEKIVKESKTQTEVLKKLGLSLRSGNYQTLLKYIDIYRLEIYHFSGKSTAYNKLKEYKEKTLMSNEDFFVNGTARSSNASKKRIFKYKLKENICEECKCNPVWNNKLLVLQLDHINGDRLDNRLENLRLLCPNCHSQTVTFSKGHKKSKVFKKLFDITIFQKDRKAPSTTEITTMLKLYCVRDTHRKFKMSLKNFKLLCEYYNIDLNKYMSRELGSWPSKVDLQKSILEKPLSQLAQDLNISDNGIKQYAKKYGLFLPTTLSKGYWLKIAKINPVKFEHLTLHNGKYVLNSSYIKE